MGKLPAVFNSSGGTGFFLFVCILLIAVFFFSRKSLLCGYSHGFFLMVTVWFSFAHKAVPVFVCG